MNDQEVARICHEVNRAYCASLGDLSQAAWEDTREDIKASAINGVAFMRSRSPITPEMQHQNWMHFKEAGGWIYGPVKDIDAKTHPCLVPYAELSKEQQTKDLLFHAVVRACQPAEAPTPKER